MIFHCCVPWCTSSNKFGGENIQFYSFPMEERLRELWIKAIGRKNFNPCKDDRICSRHFRNKKGMLAKIPSVFWDNEGNAIMRDKESYELNPLQKQVVEDTTKTQIKRESLMTHGWNLINGMRELRNETMLFDFVVITRDVSFPAHKVILASLCPYFRLAFRNQPAMTSYIMDFPADVVRIVMDYIYTGEIRFTNDNAELIFKAAELLLLEDLKKLCTDFFFENQMQEEWVMNSISKDSNSELAHPYYMINSQKHPSLHSDEKFSSPPPKTKLSNSPEIGIPPNNKNNVSNDFTSREKTLISNQDSSKENQWVKTKTEVVNTGTRRQPHRTVKFRKSRKFADYLQDSSTDGECSDIPPNVVEVLKDTTNKNANVQKQTDSVLKTFVQRENLWIHGWILVNGVKELVNENMLFDFIIMTRDVSFPAHKIVLASLSPYFKLAFRNQPAMTSLVMDFPADVVKLIVDYIYKGEIIITKDNVLIIQKAAELLLLDIVQKLCQDYLSEIHPDQESEVVSQEVDYVTRNQTYVNCTSRTKYYTSNPVNTINMFHERYSRDLLISPPLSGTEESYRTELPNIENAEEIEDHESKTSVIENGESTNRRKASRKGIPRKCKKFVEDVDDSSDSEKNIVLELNKNNINEVMIKEQEKKIKEDSVLSENEPFCDGNELSEDVLPNLNEILEEANNTMRLPYFCSHCPCTSYDEVFIQDHIKSRHTFAILIKKNVTAVKAKKRGRKRKYDYREKYGFSIPFQNDLDDQDSLNEGDAKDCLSDGGSTADEDLKTKFIFKESYSCTLCNFLSEKLSVLRGHVKDNHEPAIKEEKSSKEALSSQESHFICPICGKYCMQRHMLKQHMELHSSKKNYSCSQCSFATKTKNNLHHHIKYKHSNIKIQCPHCSYTSPARKNIKAHALRVHGKTVDILCTEEEEEDNIEAGPSSTVSEKRSSLSHPVKVETTTYDDP